MPRVSRDQTEKNRLAIEDAASRLFREQGPGAVSVAEVMAEAGLTHGGFYGHFESKEALAAVACAKAFAQSTERWSTRARSTPDPQAALKAIVDGYLSRRSRDEPGAACPAAGWVADVARGDEGTPLREAYVQGVAGLAETLTTLARAQHGKAARPQALLQLATLVGALTLARATRGTALSDEILEAARQALMAPPPRR